MMNTSTNVLVKIKLVDGQICQLEKSKLRLLALVSLFDSGFEFYLFGHLDSFLISSKDSAWLFLESL